MSITLDAYHAEMQRKFNEAIAGLLDAMRNPASALTGPAKPEGIVYFFRCGPYIKIGYSVDPRRRLTQIRSNDGTKIPDDVDPATTVLLVTEPGGRNREFSLHQKFKHLHHWGEWFTEAPELTDYIKGLAA